MELQQAADRVNPLQRGQCGHQLNPVQRGGAAVGPGDAAVRRARVAQLLHKRGITGYSVCADSVLSIIGPGTLVFGVGIASADTPPGLAAVPGQETHQDHHCSMDNVKLGVPDLPAAAGAAVQAHYQVHQHSSSSQASGLRWNARLCQGQESKADSSEAARVLQLITCFCYKTHVTGIFGSTPSLQG